MRKTNTTNEKLNVMISELKKKSEEKECKIAQRIAEDISKPSRLRREVNLSRINRYTKDGERIIVPGKVLGGGELDHKIIISALAFSGSALSKIEKSGSTIIPLEEILKGDVAGKRMRIIG